MCFQNVPLFFISLPLVFLNTFLKKTNDKLLDWTNNLVTPALISNLSAIVELKLFNPIFQLGGGICVSWCSWRVGPEGNCFQSFE